LQKALESHIRERLKSIHFASGMGQQFTSFLHGLSQRNMGAVEAYLTRAGEQERIKEVVRRRKSLGQDNSGK